MALKKADMVLIILLCIFSLSFIFILDFSKKKGGTVLITYESEKYNESLLHRDTVIDIKDENGNILNTVEINDGKAIMLSASCADGLCIKQGKIQYSNETIVCLPNKIVVEIVAGEDNEFDIIAK